MKMRLGWGVVWPEYEGFVGNHQLPGEAALWADLGLAHKARAEAVVQMDRNRVMGQSRQLALMQHDSGLLEAWGRHLPAGMAVAVDLQLLGQAWSSGLLDGRPFDVLVNRFPLGLLHCSLDAAARDQPWLARHTLFRASEQMVEEECQAIFMARRVYSAHCWVSDYLRRDGTPGGEVVRAEWVLPAPLRATKFVRPERRGWKVLYPDHGIERRGAGWLAGELLGSELDVQLISFEGEPDDAKLWLGLNHSTISPKMVGSLIEEGLDLVVLPSYMEYRPDVLLTALANQVPVIASPQCGIGDRAGLRVHRRGRMGGLCREITDVLLGNREFEEMALPC